MKRVVSSLVIVSVLLGIAVAAELRLGAIERADPLGRELLYLPSQEALQILSFGNPGLVADLLYLWAIQYYSYFEPHERFLHLETIFNLITDLDPLYFDAYRIGALVMGIQTGGDQKQVQRAAQDLLDKGLENLPESWELAEFSAWDMYLRYRDRQEALTYAEIAAEIPDAPGRIKRMVGIWRDKEKRWSVDDSIEYWRAAVLEAVDDYDRTMCLSKLYDAVLTRDRQQLQPLIDDYAERYGTCSDGWGGLIRAGLIREIPLDFSENAYGIGSESCQLVSYKVIRDQ